MSSERTVASMAMFITLSYLNPKNSKDQEESQANEDNVTNWP